MPVVFGRLESETRLRVESVAYQIDDHPDGYGVSMVPEYPDPKPGIDHIMYFNPTEGQVFFEEKARPLTQEEVLAVELPEIKAKLDQILKRLDG